MMLLHPLNFAQFFHLARFMGSTILAQVATFLYALPSFMFNYLLVNKFSPPTVPLYTHQRCLYPVSYFFRQGVVLLTPLSYSIFRI